MFFQVAFKGTVLCDVAKCSVGSSCWLAWKGDMHLAAVFFATGHAVSGVVNIGSGGSVSLFSENRARAELGSATGGVLHYSDANGIFVNNGKLVDTVDHAANGLGYVQGLAGGTQNNAFPA